MDIIAKLKEYEGTKTYQMYKGYYKNGKFRVYKDSLGYDTIGYGHLVKSGENFENGLTDAEADALLFADIGTARVEVDQLRLGLPIDSNWNDFMVLMVFQLGITKTNQFKKFLTALRAGNYATAIAEVKDSNWYRQTPNRVNKMIEDVLKG
ncbi:glycoside hydrolase family protein [Raoultella ornithinolytica]|uniref:glycoside hydrolase family protein n=1 Tax=Enterobacterales TaxID=91347 RepID=UPI0021BB0D07|nr:MULTISPECIES: glycoside hydrolase family protein [Enterobacterales]MCT8171720.1 glycoside hydrolase family protein [Raoultella ornithinolytica]UXO67304.1 glycoside hydrolase family protein [Pantoea dispersa]